MKKLFHKSSEEQTLSVFLYETGIFKPKDGEYSDIGAITEYLNNRKEFLDKKKKKNDGYIDEKEENELNDIENILKNTKGPEVFLKNLKQLIADGNKKIQGEQKTKLKEQISLKNKSDIAGVVGITSLAASCIAGAVIIGTAIPAASNSAKLDVMKSLDFFTLLFNENISNQIVKSEALKKVYTKILTGFSATAGFLILLAAGCLIAKEILKDKSKKLGHKHKIKEAVKACSSEFGINQSQTAGG